MKINSWLLGCLAAWLLGCLAAYPKAGEARFSLLA